MARLLAAMATLVAACLVLPVQPATAASAEPYGPKTPTEVVIDVDAEYSTGEEVVITYEVTANSDEGPIQGTLQISGSASAGALGAGGGDSVLVRVGAAAPAAFSETREYDASPITITVGRQSVGDYTTTASFTPSADSRYLPSSGSADYTVVAGGADQADQSVGGILPDTGGPALWWLLLALLLVSGGAGAVYYGRRRSVSSASA